jgi:hypothetical protein
MLGLLLAALISLTGGSISMPQSRHLDKVILPP